MNWQYMITRVDNGYILAGPAPEGEGQIQLLFEDGGDYQADSFVRMCRELKNLYLPETKPNARIEICVKEE